MYIKYNGIEHTNSNNPGVLCRIHDSCWE